MSRRIHLLTFSHCPPSTGQGLDEFYGRMAAQSLVFENHYLQRPFVPCPFEALGGDAPFARLRELVSADAVSVRMVVVGDASDEVTRQLPEWLNVSPMNGDAAVRLVDPVSELAAQNPAPDFLWVHAVLTPDADAEQLAELVAQSQEFVCDSQDVLIVTFLNGGAVCQPDRFQSLLFDGDIRVPLWIQSSHLPCRIQVLTGSLDIAATIAGELEGVEHQVSSQDTAAAAAHLVELAETSAAMPNRRLFINAGDVVAVRTTDFLFAQSGAGLDSLSALYVKPEDVWNLNDVSSEYHEVVENFGGLLRPDGVDGHDAAGSDPS